MRTCYKKDSKGKIRITEFKTEDHLIIMSSGLLTGKRTVKEVPCKAKNIGRSNETSAEQQVVLELESRFKKKLDEGYFETVEEAENNIVVLPMLARSCDLSKLTYPVILSPKLDGMRAFGNTNDSGSTLKSRKGKLIDTLPHIKFPSINEHVHFDGELYSHGDDFQTNMKLIKKNREESTRINFYIYDIYTHGMDLEYIERHAMITNEVLSHDTEHVIVVPYVLVYNEHELKEQHQQYLSLGYEGSMVRINEIPYELNKRSNSLLKYKDFIDEVYSIIDVVPNEKSPKQGTLIVGNNKVTFKCGMKMSHEDREQLLVNKEVIIGRKAEVRFFEYSQDGVPRFPVCVGIREDK